MALTSATDRSVHHKKKVSRHTSKAGALLVYMYRRPGLKSKVAEYAEAKGQSMSDVVMDILEKYLDEGWLG
ncbi:MAG: hypothetical protein ACXABY_09835 [Candidatus Thorarchaeota archaeon]|jgi:hypothetical protein